jgi:hypothetical protein
LIGKPSFTLPAGPYVKHGESIPHRLEAFSKTGFFLVSGPEIPFDRGMGNTEEFRKLQVVRQLREFVTHGWDMSIVKDPIPFLRVKPMKTQTKWSAGPPTD